MTYNHVTLIGHLVQDPKMKKIGDKERADFNIECQRTSNKFNDLKEIDVFLHDSIHTYENMMFEYKTSWPYIKKGGILLSDLMPANSAFFDFCKHVNRQCIKLRISRSATSPSMTVVVKNSFTLGLAPTIGRYLAYSSSTIGFALKDI